MLICCRSMAEIDFQKLMYIYREGNLENGRIKYPYLSEIVATARAEDDFYDYLCDDFFLVKDSSYWIWDEEGNYRSALRLEPYEDGYLLEALETDPDCRRKGYARKLILSVCNALPDTKIYSHVHKRNIASLETHRSCGFQICKDFARYVNGTVSQNAFTMEFHKKDPEL